MIQEQQDAFGHELQAYIQGKPVSEIIERDDGLIALSRGPAAYLAPFEEWPCHEQESIQFARGRVLDIGCGAGRVGLYLQEKGHPVVGIDNSPLSVQVCRQRGLQEVHLLSITQIGPHLGCFDTIVMFGNNFGLFGSAAGARRLLRRFVRLTSPQAHLIVTSTEVYATDNPIHLAYHARNRARGRMAGQLRLRVRFENIKGPWFDYLLVSKEEMAELVDGTGWRISRFFDNPDLPVYAALLEKLPTG
jgi:SAM-dependent methyltransferase